MKIAYIHGRYGPHLMHGKLAKSLGAEFQIVDEYKIWNDKVRPRLYLIYAWIYNALAFKNVTKYNVFLVSGPHFSPVIMKIFRLKKNQKIICHLGDETMYFLYDHWYSAVMRKTLISLLNKYDVLYCEGQMAADLARLNGIVKPKIYTTYLGVPIERQENLRNLKPNITSYNLISICSGPNGWREYYKGIDLMIDAYFEAFKVQPNLTLTIVGLWDVEVQNKLTSALSKACEDSINFIGHTNEIEKYLLYSSIYLHTSRGDAFPTSVLEAMSAGLIPLISEWTGSKEVVAKVDDSLIVPINKELIAKKIIELIELPIKKKEELSSKSKEVSKEFTEEFALSHYQNTFKKTVIDFNLKS